MSWPHHRWAQWPSCRRPWCRPRTSPYPPSTSPQKIKWQHIVEISSFLHPYCHTHSVECVEAGPAGNSRTTGYNPGRSSPPRIQCNRGQLPESDEVGRIIIQPCLFPHDFFLILAPGGPGNWVVRIRYRFAGFDVAPKGRFCYIGFNSTRFRAPAESANSLGGCYEPLESFSLRHRILHFLRLTRSSPESGFFRATSYRSPCVCRRHRNS